MRQRLRPVGSRLQHLQETPHRLCAVGVAGVPKLAPPALAVLEQVAQVVAPARQEPTCNTFRFVLEIGEFLALSCIPGPHDPGDRSVVAPDERHPVVGGERGHLRDVEGEVLRRLRVQGEGGPEEGPLEGPPGGDGAHHGLDQVGAGAAGEEVEVAGVVVVEEGLELEAERATLVLGEGAAQEGEGGARAAN